MLEDVSKDQDGFYVCAGTNGITNFINSSEKVIISLFVQGTYIHTHVNMYICVCGHIDLYVFY